MESKFTLHFLFLYILHFLQLALFSQGINTTNCQDLAIKAEITPACASGSSGHVRIIVDQGLPPYSVSWEDGNTGISRSLPTGSYRVQVQDVLGCQGEAHFTINTHTELTATAQVDHTSKSGKRNGTITINAVGGKPPYHYSWLCGTDENLTIAPEMNQARKLPSGIYKVVIFDAAGCYFEIETEVR